MRRANVLLLAILVGGGVLFFRHFRIDGLEQLGVAPRAGGPVAPRGTLGIPAATRARDALRIATFNIQVLGVQKASHIEVMAPLAEILRRFDVVAIQEIRATDQDVLPRLVDQVNSAGVTYDYVIGPRVGRGDQLEQLAFIFDTARVEVDRPQLYSINDPDDLLRREPFVASFRALGPQPDSAFTFTLINVHSDPDEAAEEAAVLDDVYRSVRDDGRLEDDIILLGDLNLDETRYGELGRIGGIAWAVSGVPTNTRGTHAYDNILFTLPATAEYRGRSGVFDFLREFNLSIEQATQISDHLPVWAEFSIIEGGEPGRVAAAESTVR